MLILKSRQNFTMNTDLSYILGEMQKCKEDIGILRKLILFSSSKNRKTNCDNFAQCQEVLASVLDIFTNSTEVERERMLLASHAFFALLSAENTGTQLGHTFLQFLQLDSKELIFFDKTYDVNDVELFKLTCSYGFLQANRENMYSKDVFLKMFDIIYENSIKYTKHSYFAYRVLHLWLKRTLNTDLWHEDESFLEEKLEGIIFSNWSNAINEISKQNSGPIFSLYLQIMSAKYDGFLLFIFRNCLNNLSWQNEIKYVILTEICENLNNSAVITDRNFLLGLSTSLTKSHLRCAGTKVYIMIMKKLSEEEWKAAFGEVLKYLFHRWDTLENPRSDCDSSNRSALQFLCRNWIEPAVIKYRDILPYLWELTESLHGLFIKSHVQRMASEVRITLHDEVDINLLINHKDEIIRLNGFIICCNRAHDSSNWVKSFSLIQDFLWHNANTTSMHIREGIAKYFKVFFVNLLKACDTNSNVAEDVYRSVNWLHTFFLDCLEIGSCYQRKILGLNLYKATLSFTNGSALNKCNNMESTHCSMLLEKHLAASGNWNFTNKKSLFLLIRLVLDSSSDIKHVASRIILDFFDKNILSELEKRVLYNVALEHCNSSKFYKVESGAALVLLLANWLPLHALQFTCDESSKYSDFLYKEAAEQLTDMKDDILKAVVRNKPFYGVLAALLRVAFQNGPENSHLSLEFCNKILELLRNATEFFLSVLSSKSKNIEFSSSFAEMGLAIDEAIKTSEIDDCNHSELSLSPAHQVLISCIWMSLKVSCEIACEIGRLMLSKETVEQSANIIVTVLFRCRHKGVVESAGAAIGNLSKVLCKEAEYASLPRSYIINILQKSPKESLNITRRGAGLSIMFHKIVVNDNRIDRPLLHFALDLLLDLLDNSLEVDNVESQENDSPCARRLHFLRALVADKEIHAQLIPYMERICLTGFRYLESEIWTIRNASLQLFGAIVPRLVGQVSGESSLDYGTGYSINHFSTHYPKLAQYVMRELKRFRSTFLGFSCALYRHSSIVPILILLSKFSYTDCTFVDVSSNSFVVDAKDLLYGILENPVYYVRSLAAKAYAALTPFSSIDRVIASIESDISSGQSPNKVHGLLLTVKYLNDKLRFEMSSVGKSEESREHQHEKQNALSTYEDSSHPCYIVRSLLLELSYLVPAKPDDMFILDESSPVFLSQKLSPGFFQFLELSMKGYAEYIKCTKNIAVQPVDKILHSPCKDLSTTFLAHLSHSTSIVRNVLELLLSTHHNCEILYQSAMINFVLRSLQHSLFSTSKELNLEDVIDRIKIDIDKHSCHTKLWYLKSVLILLFSNDETVIHNLLSHVLNISVEEEEHTRQTAVGLLEFALYRFTKFAQTSKLLITYACLILLKDEISEFRESIAEGLRAHVLPQFDLKYSGVLHEEVIYQKLLLEAMTNGSFFPYQHQEESLYFIKLFTSNIRSLDADVTIENPFYHDDSTFFKEESKFLNTCYFFAASNKEDNNLVGTSESSFVHALSIIKAKHQLEEMIAFNITDLLIVLNTKYTDYLLRKQGIVLLEYGL